MDSALRMILIVFMTGISIAVNASAPYMWENSEKHLYFARRFAELEHTLTLQGRVRLASELQLQEEDLSGCRHLHEGIGNVRQMIQCVRFLYREKKWGLSSPGSQTLVEDINILCQKLVTNPSSVEKLISSQVFKAPRKEWRPCTGSVWKQVYLTTYANFNATPVSSLSLVRKAQRGLPKDRTWERKLLKFLKNSP